MSPSGQKRKSRPCDGMSAFARIVLQNSQNAVLPISPKQTKRAEIAERYSLQAVTEVARELWQNNVVPQMIIRSPNVRPGEFAIGDAKRLLQQYPPVSGHRQAVSACPKSAISGSRAHSITSSPRASTLAGMVTRAARLFAILLRIARGLRHADKGPPRL